VLDAPDADLEVRAAIRAAASALEAAGYGQRHALAAAWPDALEACARQA